MATKLPPPGGLQKERTYLAWHRTTLSLAAVGVLVLHEFPRSPGGVGFLVVGALALALAATAVGSAELRYVRRTCSITSLRSHKPPASLIAVVAAGTTVLPLTLLLTQLFTLGRS